MRFAPEHRRPPTPWHQSAAAQWRRFAAHDATWSGLRPSTAVSCELPPWLLLAMIAPHLRAPWTILATVLLVGVPAATASWFFARCGGRTRAGAPCLRTRRGFARRCADHIEILSIYDWWGAAFAVLTALAALFSLRYVL
ncbi:hypothetical protein [Nocardia asteroides]|uniref:hypothetical protein n=1 Tax=Nocardia asteroides TaxID=1824 RepID=UPI001E4B6A56|nr:hypothetical protein [Nocardia asteroides]UGT58920.1 hypothetical protein LTT85_33070 [Nocardia asteroides]